MDKADFRFSVAPMMDWTDRHCRFFHRLLTRRARLYTEMITADAVLYGDRERLIGFSAEEHPVALQLGGAEPKRLAAAARIAEDFGYDEVNLNCGCPSDRVKAGTFGACLMREPDRVAQIVAAMKAAVRIPVTVKCRIGVDDQDPEIALRVFVRAVAAAGADAVVVHARKAWLQGLSPRDNRIVPPLDHGLVHRVKAENPGLIVVLNGGLQTLDPAAEHLAYVDGVMFGRAAYENPALLAGVDRRFFGETGPDPDPVAVVAALVPYAERVVASGGRVSSIARHVLGLFNGRPGARAFRRHLAEEAVKPGAGAEVLSAALAHLRLQDRREREALAA